MEKENLAGRVVCLGLKKTDFDGITAQKKLPNYVYRYEDVFKTCIDILNKNWPFDPVRLIRVRVSECKHIDELKKDKRITEFTTKVSDSQWRQDVELRLQRNKLEVEYSKRQQQLLEAPAET